MEILNAKITSTKLTMEDHGCLTFWLTLEGSGWGVGFGGYCIGKGYLGSDDFEADNGWGLEAMMRIMDVVGVDTWEKLEGQFVRVKITDGWGGSCRCIGNLMNDKWFDIKAFFDRKMGEKP